MAHQTADTANKFQFVNLFQGQDTSTPTGNTKPKAIGPASPKTKPPSAPKAAQADKPVLLKTDKQLALEIQATKKAQEKAALNSAILEWSDFLK